MKKRKKNLLWSLFVTIILLGGASYAYFSIRADIRNQTANLSTGTMSLVFSDNDNGINTTIAFGESVTKKFKIQNTGSLESSLSLDWKGLINTYQFGSLTYTLSYSASEDAELYEEITPQTNVPVSQEPMNQTIEGELSVPAGETYYYNLTLTLNNLPDVVQNADLNAHITTGFTVDQPVKYRYYTLSIDPNGGAWNSSTAVYRGKMKNGETREVEDPVRRGYIFKGWQIKGVSSTIENGSFKMGISDTILEATWEASTHTLTIDPNGGEYSGEASVILKTDESIEIQTPTREGYTFTGWSTSSSGLSGNTFTMGVYDETLRATWAINQYKYIVYHHQMDLTGENYTLVGADTDEGEADYNSTISPDPKTYDGFGTVNKKSLTIQVEDSYPPVKNKIDYQYPRNKYTLTIDPNGGVYDGETRVTLYYRASTTIKTPTKTGYNFMGWSITGGVLTGDTFTITSSDVTLTAEYEPISIGVTFNANGGTVEEKSKLVTYDETYGDLPTPVYTKITGFEFLGWYTDPEEGTKIESTTQVSTTTDQVLYAHWNPGIFNIPEAVVAVLNNKVPKGVRTDEQSYDGVVLTPEVVETINATYTPQRTYYTYFDDASGTNPQVCAYEECAADLVGKYINPNSKSNTPTIKPISDPVLVLSATGAYISYIRSSIRDYSFKLSFQYSDSFDEALDLNNSQICYFEEDCYYDLPGKYIYSPSVQYYSDRLYKVISATNDKMEGINYITRRSWTTNFASDIGYIFGDDYTFNLDTKEFSLTNPQSCIGEACQELIIGKYSTPYIYNADLTTLTGKIEELKSANSFTDINFNRYIKDDDLYYAQLKYREENHKRYVVAGDSYEEVINSYSGSSPYYEIQPKDSSVYEYTDPYSDLIGKYVNRYKPQYGTVYTSASNYVYKILEADRWKWKVEEIYINGIDKPVPSNFVYYSGYSFDQNTKKFTLSGTKTEGNYSVLYSDSVGKYVSKIGSTEYESSNVEFIYRVASATETEVVLEKLAATKAEVGTYDESNNGVYSYKDEYGDSYFYRGSVTNNYVRFAGFSWRALRVNGEGSVRLVYDGYRHENGSTLSLPIQASWTPSGYSGSKYADNKVLGWQFGPSGSTNSTSKEQTRTREVSSQIRTVIQSWYSQNISSKSDTNGVNYSEYIATSKFCNDRSTPGFDKTGYNNDTGLGYGKNLTGYGALARFVDPQNGWISRVNVKPTLICPENEDVFEEEVGILTADEVVLAGGGWKFNNNKYFLYTGYDEWLMTPFRYSTHARMMTLNSTGELGDYEATSSRYARPVINIKAEYARAMRGDGSITNPYYIPS